MAGDINSVAIVGRLTREAEHRVSQNGGGVLRFSIAVNRRKKVGEDWEDEAHFFNCTLMGRQADTMCQYLTKGKQVAIRGELRQNKWTDQQGQARSSVEIFVQDIQLVGPRDDQQGYVEQPAQPQQTRTRAQMYGNQRPPQAPSQYAGRSSAPDTYRMAPNPDGKAGPEVFSDDEVPF